MPSSYLAFALPGGFEWVVILLVAFLIFGRKLPSLMRGLGSSIREFKDGVTEPMEKSNLSDAHEPIDHTGREPNA